MQLKFKINYKTQVGQVIKILGNVPQLGNNNAENALEMFPVDGENGDWDCIIEIPLKDKKELKYKYFLENINTNERFFEWGDNRIIDLKKKLGNKILFHDFWRSTKAHENTYFSSAFYRVLFKRDITKNKAKEIIKDNLITLKFNLTNIRVNKNHFIAITGNIKELGKWDKNKVLILNDCSFPHWSKQIPVNKKYSKIIYRYCIVDSKTKKIITEETSDRILELERNYNYVVRNDQYFKYPDNFWKGAGVAIPVFSLRTKNSHGVGEFLDLKYLVDWAKKTGLKLIQILPVNDTVATHTWVDSYPYAAISVFALHPIYLNLKAIGNLSSKITQEIVDEQKKLLNSKEKVDYEAVMKIKSRFYKLIFDEQKDYFLKTRDFQIFFKQNKQWLVPYAAFSYLRDLFGTPDFTKWGRFSNPSEKLFIELSNPNAPHYDDIAIHYFIQYHLHKQLLEAADYARKNGIILKGDIPIGIFRHSVDAWLAPELYNINAQAGAPPDDFAELGQNWKFPTYNWEQMKKDNFSWWKKRLQKMSTYFDAFRIDHILGFFRIWEIPESQVQGIMGYFNPSIPVYINEFEEKKINFDFFRFCTPFIREYMLEQIFGNLVGYIKSVFLIQYEFGKYYIKEDFNTQKKVKDYININDADSQKEKTRKQRILEGMYKLLSEILFLKYPHNSQQTYIPRHSLYKTYSFNALDDFTKQKVMELYNDYYYRRNEDFWKQQAYIKLPAIKKATDMLICGEDLGMIPKCVPQVMDDLNILSLEIQRMPKNTDLEFAHPDDYPYLSVASPSSHDTSTIRAWWEEDSSRSQRFFNKILGKTGASPYFCEPWIVKDIIVQHIYSPSMWTIFPIQDLLGMDKNLRFLIANEERINNPSNPRHYWRYRLHLNIENLLKETDFNTLIKNMLKESNRYYNY